MAVQVVLILLGVVVFAAVGHVLWLGMEAVVRLLAGMPPRGKEATPHLRHCPRCGEDYSGKLLICPECRLAHDSPRAQRFRDLNAAGRQIRDLMDQNLLDPALADQVFQALDQQRVQLGGERSRRRDEIPVPPPLEPKPAPSRHPLEDLLHGTANVEDLPLDARRQALHLYRQMNQEEVSRLSPSALLPLTRLLRVAGLSSRGLGLAERLVRDHPTAPQAPAAILDGVRLALELDQAQKARWFLEQARRQRWTEAEEATLQELWRGIPLEALPVTESSTDLELKAPSLPAPAAPEYEPPPTRKAPAPLSPREPAEAAPSRSWGQVLAGFMEEKNILWGELVGGLLIVGCSIALVISLWQRLEAIPYFPFFIFAVLTAAIFGAGLYTLSHWKLEATSRGLLVIGTLLTPLNFLILARFSKGREAGWLDIAIEVLAVGIFAFFVWRSGHVLLPESLHDKWGKAFLALAVVGASTTQLLVPTWLDLAEPILWLFVLLSLLPVACHAAGVLSVWLRLRGRGVMDQSSALGLLFFLGLSSFSLAVALGFLAYWSTDPLTTLRHLSVPLALGCVPVVLAGGLLHERLAGVPGDEEEKVSPSTLRLMGTIIGLVGMGLMLVALALAWPRPLGLILVGLLNAAFLFSFALSYRLPLAHLPAALCLAISVLTVFHFLAGAGPEQGVWTGPELLELFFSAPSALPLVLFAAVLVGASEMGAWLGKRGDALSLLAAAGVLGLLGILVALREAEEVPERATFVLLLSGLVGMAVNIRWSWQALTWAASFLLLSGSWYLLGWTAPLLVIHWRWLLSFLGMATVFLAARVILSHQARTRGWSEFEKVFGEPLEQFGGSLTFVALMPLLMTMANGWLADSALAWVWLSGLWLLIAIQKEKAPFFAFFQAGLLAAALVGTGAWLKDQDWFEGPLNFLVRWQSWQAYGLALGGYCLAWAIARHLLGPFPRFKMLIEGVFPGVDQVAQGALELGQFLLIFFALLPHVLRELYPAHFLEPVFERLGDGSFNLISALVLLGLTALARIVSLWKVGGPLGVGLLAWAALLACLLGALAFREERAIASALRWGLALLFLVGSAFLWARKYLGLLGRALHLRPRNQKAWLPATRVLFLALCLVPVLVLTGIIALEGFQGRRSPGPLAGSIFHQMGWLASVTIPLGFLIAGLTGTALRENSAEYFFSAGWLVLATVMGGYALGLVLAGKVLGPVENMRLVQLGILAASGWALVWLWTGRWRDFNLLSVQVGLPALALLLLVLRVFVPLVGEAGEDYPVQVLEAGRPLGWGASASFLAAGLWFLYLLAPKALIHLIGAGALLLGVQVGCTAARGEVAGWLGYHALILSWTLTGVFLALQGWSGTAGPRGGEKDAAGNQAARLLRVLFPAQATRRWVEAITGLIVLLALHDAWNDPEGDWWSVGTILAACLLMGSLALWARHQVYVYVSGALFNLAGYLFWHATLPEGLELPVGVGLEQGWFDQFLCVQLICLLTAAAVWTLLEGLLRRRAPPLDLRGRVFPFSLSAVLLAIPGLGLLIVVLFCASLVGVERTVHAPLIWTTLGLALGILALFLWDHDARPLGIPETAWYALGVLGILFGQSQEFNGPTDLLPIVSVSLGGFLLAVSMIAWAGPRLAAWAQARNLPLGSQVSSTWFLITQMYLGLLVLGLSFWACLDLETLSERLLGPLAASLLFLAALVLAFCWPRLAAERSYLGSFPRLAHHVTLVLFCLGAVELAWAVLGPETNALWLHRLVLLLAVLIVVAGSYLFLLAGLAPAESVWARVARVQVPWLVILAGLTLGVVLGLEFLLFDPVRRTTPLEWPAVLLVAVLLAAVCAACFWLAVVRRNPLGFSLKGRQRLVYGAEILLVLLLLHVRLNYPHLFTGFMGRFWPFLLMGLGFLGVGLGELFRRRNVPALAEPLHRTGLFLPLLPLLAYLLRPLGNFEELGEAVPGFQPFLRFLHNLPGHAGLHALLWFLLGTIYLTLAVVRRGTGWALFAALAANFGLWVLYTNTEGLSFLLHPQIWLAPLGLIVLVAEYLNRSHLTRQQSQAVRYFGLLVIYLSSTADLFIHGLGESVLLPIALAVLAILGVLAGILLRVRAFLFMGVSFLFLVIFAQIWHAAVDRGQTWLWWASGIVLGAAILTLFALFEKRRNEVLKVIEEIKRWE